MCVSMVCVGWVLHPALLPLFPVKCWIRRDHDIVLAENECVTVAKLCTTAAMPTLASSEASTESRVHLHAKWLLTERPVHQSARNDQKSTSCISYIYICYFAQMSFKEQIVLIVGKKNSKRSLWACKSLLTTGWVWVGGDDFKKGLFST